MSTFRVLLAATLEGEDDLQRLRYPLIGSPKVDGIRCFIHPQLGPVTRKLKPIPNRVIRHLLTNTKLVGLDGEIVSGHITAPDVFNRSQSAVMTHESNPEFTFWIFDRHVPGTATVVGYESRLKHMVALSSTFPNFVKVLPNAKLPHAAAAQLYEHVVLGEGYEGIMLRDPNGHYKMNRSTLREQILLKLKQFQDGEAEIVGFEALERNNNAPTRNAMGLQERSSQKAGKVADNTLGNLLVRHPTFGDFSIGSGFDDALRTQIWANRRHHLGQTITFKYQSTGIKDKPRFPIFKGFRPDGV